MRVLVIGGTGFIGSHVVRRLIGGGHHVTVLCRGTAEADPPASATLITGDRDALDRLAPRLRHLHPDVILDVIPYTERQARDLVHLFRGHAGRVVALSSGDVYRNYDGFRGAPSAPPDPVPLAEDAPLRESRYPYRGHDLSFPWADDYDKILVEHALHSASDLPATVLRLPAVYGPGDRQRRLRPYLQRMDDGRPAILLGKQHAAWQWTRGYVENVAAAVAVAATDDRAVGRTYNVGEAVASTERGWVESMGAAAGWRGEVVVLPEGALPRHVRQPFDYRYGLATDTSRIRTELGFEEPVGVHEALTRTIAWERAQPPVMARPDYAAEDAALTA